MKHIGQIIEERDYMSRFTIEKKEGPAYKEVMKGVYSPVKNEM